MYKLFIKPVFAFFKCSIHIRLILYADNYIRGGELVRVRKRFQHPLLIIKPATMTQKVDTTIAPYQHYEMVSYTHKNLPVNALVSYPILGGEIARARKRFYLKFSKNPQRMLGGAKLLFRKNPKNWQKVLILKKTIPSRSFQRPSKKTDCTRWHQQSQLE